MSPMRQQSCTWVLLIACCVSSTLFANEVETDAIEIDPQKIAPITAEDKQAIESWLIDLESTPLLARKIAVIVTGSYFIGGRVKNVETISARQFAICWANKDGLQKQRVILRDEGLLNPSDAEENGDRYMRSNSNALDQLTIDQRYHEAAGLQLYPESKKNRLTQRLKLAGVFYPLAATTATATEWYGGSAMNPTSARVEIERLTGVYRQSDLTIAEFYYQSTNTAVLHRFVVFREGVPIQVDDRMAVSNAGRFRAIRLLQPSPEDLKQLAKTRKQSFDVARTRTEWIKVKPDLQLPSKLRSRTISGPHSIEVSAKCTWWVNDDVKPLIFKPGSVGKLSPLQLMESGAR